MQPPSNLLATLAILGVLGLAWAVHARGEPACPPGDACLRYMAWGNPEQIKTEEDLIGRFNAENPKIHVSLMTVPSSSYQQKVTLMLATGTAPDVMRVDHYYFPKLVEDDYFTDLTPYAQGDPTFKESDFWPTAIAEGTYKGKLYGLNVLFGGEVTYYNKSLFKAAGLTDPWVLAQRGEWTWETFRKDAIALTKFGPDGEPLTFGELTPGMPTLTAIVRGFGADWVNANHTKSTLDDPRAAKAMQFIADLVWKDHAAPTPAQGANNAFAFETGKVGMYFDWMGMTPRFRNLVHDFEWDVCTMPTDTRGDNFIVKGNQLVVSTTCPHKDAAWQFLKFMTGPEAEGHLAGDLRRTFPSRISVAEGPKFLTCTKPPYQIAAFVDCVKEGRILPIDDRWNEWTQEFTSGIDNLMGGREHDARAALLKVKAKVDQTLSEPPGF